MKYCRNCGNQMEDSEFVCPHCGMREEVPAPPVSSTNAMAVAGFVCAFFMPLLGLIFSIIGLVKVKEYHSGKGFAIAGIVISALIWLMSLVLILCYAFFLGSIFFPIH